MSQDTERAATIAQQAQAMIDRGLDDAMRASALPTAAESLALIAREFEVLQLLLDAVRLLGSELDALLAREVARLRSDRMAVAT